MSELDPIASSNRYTVRYQNFTLDTMVCSDRRFVRRIASCGGFHSDRLRSVARIPTLLDLDLSSASFRFSKMSMDERPTDKPVLSRERLNLPDPCMN